ncbi:MAG: helix-turn-helix transcriptional regulator [Bdellovibrionaceae bacterium]|nr:helix-turn-helix transcriptional regulator [Pseudobdellovibrionaceae bacterium]
MKHMDEVTSGTINPFFNGDDGNSKKKSSLRASFEVSAQGIRNQIGGLKGVQAKLGLNQRKLAQLLMVDPSTWNRWLKDEDKVPPHIWRALQWYLALEEKLPGLNPQIFIGSTSYPPQIDQKLNEMKQQLTLQLKEEINHELVTLQKTVKTYQRIAWFVLFLLILVSTILMGMLFYYF